MIAGKARIMIPKRTLNDGNPLPAVGFGTWRLAEGQRTIDILKTALSLGYRHIDTAARYENEVSVGTALSESGVARSSLFVVSKVWNDMRGYESTLRACRESLAKLKLAYLDLYLIHWPATEKFFSNADALNLETWRALETLQADGLVRSIGVSNFLPHHLQPLLDKGAVVPAVDQIKLHPGLPQAETMRFCLAHGILPEAWSPLGAGKLLASGPLRSIAERCGQSPAQVCVRWCIQRGAVPVVKSSTPERMRENRDVFGFVLTESDMEALDRLPAVGSAAPDPDSILY
jgi:diketogulonate reductase-like aldo/keto reductase